MLSTAAGYIPTARCGGSSSNVAGRTMRGDKQRSRPAWPALRDNRHTTTTITTQIRSSHPRRAARRRDASAWTALGSPFWHFSFGASNLWSSVRFHAPSVWLCGMATERGVRCPLHAFVAIAAAHLR
jgi:hypothetical protein